MEQSYKEKYERALAKLRGLIDGIREEKCEIVEDDIIDIFPELAESEDEKARKAIMALIEWSKSYSASGITNDDAKKMLSWLEKQGQERKITHEEICKCCGIPDIGEFSDGYHTFNGLYKQRMILFAVLVKTYKDRAWKSWKHEDGLDCFGGGWFIVGIDTPAGTYTYHYEAKDWDRFDCQILEKAKHWDGHDEYDVERLFSLVSNTNKDEVIRCLINGMKFYCEDNEEATWGTEKFSMKVKDILDWLEKQKPADKVEPKFKVGDFIVNDYCMGRVVEITNDAYLLDTEQGIPFSCHSTRLWDVTKDAKDGDVLANDTIVLIVDHLGTFENRPIIYSWYFANSNKFYGLGPSEPDRWEVEGFYPATKEQREQLKKTMADAGYTFDFENKKLKKIEPKTEENKGNIGGISPNWSVEDMSKVQRICKYLNEAKKYYADITEVRECIEWLKSLQDRVQPKQEWSEEDDYYRNCIIQIIEEINNAPLKRREDWDAYITWLKSLRPQNKWKPSDEQMIALLYHCSNGSVLSSLYNDLKKLKEL